MTSYVLSKWRKSEGQELETQRRSKVITPIAQARTRNCCIDPLRPLALEFSIELDVEPDAKADTESSGEVVGPLRVREGVICGDVGVLIGSVSPPRLVSL